MDVHPRGGEGYVPTKSRIPQRRRLDKRRTDPKSLRRQNRNSQAPKPNRATDKAVCLMWTTSIPAVDKRIPHVAKIFPRVASHEF